MSLQGKKQPLRWRAQRPMGAVAVESHSLDLHVRQEGWKLYVSCVFVFEESSIGFPISASIPNTTLMSAHLLIAASYLSFN